MLLSKAHLYSEEEQIASFYFGGFDYPTRLRIIRMLRDQGPHNVFDLWQGHPISLSAFSQHIEILRKKELVDFTPKYPYLIYHLDEENYERSKNCILNFFLKE